MLSFFRKISCPVLLASVPGLHVLCIPFWQYEPTEQSSHFKWSFVAKVPASHSKTQPGWLQLYPFGQSRGFSCPRSIQYNPASQSQHFVRLKIDNDSIIISANQMNELLLQSSYSNSHLYMKSLWAPNKYHLYRFRWSNYSKNGDISSQLNSYLNVVSR